MFYNKILCITTACCLLIIINLNLANCQLNLNSTQRAQVYSICQKIFVQSDCNNVQAYGIGESVANVVFFSYKQMTKCNDAFFELIKIVFDTEKDVLDLIEECLYTGVPRCGFTFLKDYAIGKLIEAAIDRIAELYGFEICKTNVARNWRTALNIAGIDDMMSG